LKTRAAVLYEMEKPRPYVTSRPLVIEELDLAPPGDGELLVRVRAAGLCHSDLSTINGDRPRQMPMALGHEAAGEVVEVGPGVKDLAVGDHVILVFVPSCGHCIPCAEGRPALCEPGARANGAGTLLGLYEGVALTRRTSHYNLAPPDKITIFRGPILQICPPDEDAVRAQIRRTVLHEIAHHFGISDERLLEIGAY
jgi:alcohol dehydrogenase